MEENNIEKNSQKPSLKEYLSFEKRHVLEYLLKKEPTDKRGGESEDSILDDLSGVFSDLDQKLEEWENYWRQETKGPMSRQRWRKDIMSFCWSLQERDMSGLWLLTGKTRKSCTATKGLRRKNLT